MLIRDRRVAPAGALVASIALVTACGSAEPPAVEEAASWSVTAWGDSYEVFPEVDPLVAGEPAAAHTHVTILDGFQPLEEGVVAIVLRGEAGEQTFEATAPARPGIWNIEIEPSAAGDYDLSFRIRSPAGDEEIPGGAVRVGAAAAPGTQLRAPAPRGASAGGEPVAFLKEQQWQTRFATSWVRRGVIPESVRGLARVRPPAGGDAALTASSEAIVHSSPWPYPGQEVRRGDVLFRLMPRVASERSLPEIGAEIASLEAEAVAARARLARLEELVRLEAVSLREVEEARARVASTEARLEALRRDQAAASAARDGRGEAYLHAVRAPFDGKVAEVTASPGAAVAPGDGLGRLVRSGPVWLEVDLAPAAAGRVGAGGVRGVVIESAGAAPLEIPAAEVRLVAVAPTLDPAKGTVATVLELESAGLVLGTTVDAQVLLATDREGIVVPVAAIVDDGGEAVAYLQLSGERFARQPVEVLSRQGGLALVGGLVPGQRLVTAGGDAIRRASLLSTGAAQGHVH